MTLYGVRINRDDLVQRVQGDISVKGMRLGNCSNKDANIPDIVVAVTEEFTQYVDSHYTQPAICFDLEHGQHSFVENGVSNIL